MKKVCGLMVCACILLTMVGCFDQQPTKEKHPTDQTSSGEAQKEETFSLNETAVFKNLKITATDMKETKGDEMFGAEAGKTFVGIQFMIENVSDEEQTVSSLLLFDAYADDVQCGYSFTAGVVFADGTLDGSIAPGKKLIGWYAVEIPENWSTLELAVKPSWLSDSAATFVFRK